MSQQLKDQLSRFQQMQTQLQMLQQQRYQVESQLKEVEEALEELAKTSEKSQIYKSVGSVLIKAKNKKDVIQELESTKESLDLRKNTINKQEGRTREKLTELQSKVQNAMKISDTDNV
jgi:prefoldin beta subunit